MTEKLITFFSKYNLINKKQIETLQKYAVMHQETEVHSFKEAILKKKTMIIIISELILIILGIWLIFPNEALHYISLAYELLNAPFNAAQQTVEEAYVETAQVKRIYVWKPLPSFWEETCASLPYNPNKSLVHHIWWYQYVFIVVPVFGYYFADTLAPAILEYLG